MYLPTQSDIHLLDSQMQTRCVMLWQAASEEQAFTERTAATYSTDACNQQPMIGQAAASFLLDSSKHHRPDA